MISRYSRKSAAHHLHTRALSHMVLDHIQPPEEVSQECKLPTIHHLELPQPSASHSSLEYSPPVKSGCPSAVAVETSRLWSGTDSCTGLSSERSSVFSWAYDEFDKAASRQVQKLFEEIDEELYEEKGGVQQEECKQWGACFPHLRVLGKQLLSDEDDGFQHFSDSPERSEASTSPTHCRHNDCKGAVLELLFEGVWRELIGYMEALLLRMWLGTEYGDGANLVSTNQAHDFLGSILSDPCTLPHFAPTTPHASYSLYTPTTKSRNSKSKWKSKKQLKALTLSRGSVGSVEQQQKSLKELIVVQSFPLQQRHASFPERPAHDVEEQMGLSKPCLHQALGQSPSPLPRPPPTSQRRVTLPRTLFPLSQSSSNTNREELLRGTRLVPAADHLSSSVLTLSRHSLLPPIITSDPDHMHTVPQTRLNQRHRAHATRAHSAVGNESGALLPAARPNTTHTFRSDSPCRRSFTLLESCGQKRTASAAATDSLCIGVTGISVGISSSSSSSLTNHIQDHALIEDEEDSNLQAPPTGPVLHRSHCKGGIKTHNKPGS